MHHTIAAVFDRQASAQQAMQDLVASGFPRDHVHISQEDDDSLSRGSARADEDDQSFGSGIRSFFAELFGPSDTRYDAELYSEAVRRGNYVLTVNVDEDEEVDRATDVIDRYHPVDIDEQASEWKSGGWTAQQSMRQDDDLESRQAASRSAPQSEQESIPVAREEPKVGKRRAQRAGVRVYQREPDALADDDDSYFRQHWTSNFGSEGGRYEDYAPAYQYGSRQAGSDRYRGRQWAEVESDVRSDWEARNPGSAWDKFKAAIRHGWERMTS